MPAARLPHRHRRHCRRSIAVRVEEGLGDLERAPLIVMSKYFMVLVHSRETRSPGSVVLCVCVRCLGNALMYRRKLARYVPYVGGGSRWDRYGQRGAGWVVTGLGGNGKRMARLLRIFVHRLLRQHGFEALLLGCWGEKSEV